MQRFFGVSLEAFWFLGWFYILPLLIDPHDFNSKIPPRVLL